MRTSWVERAGTLAMLLACGGAVPALRAQNQPTPREPRGFDFSPNGVWRRRANAVRAARSSALARGDVAALNGPMASANLVGPNACGQGPLVVCGTQFNPVVLVQFKNTSAGTLRAPSEYDATLLAATPTLGRPFTLRTFYEEISNGLFSVQGQVIGWTALDSNDTWYEGNCNGDVTCNGGGHVAKLIEEAILKNDAAVDYGQFDNDGPDGVPNSGDDDGYVDLLILVHPEGDGACGTQISNPNKNLWSHRFFYDGWGTGTPLVTNDISARPGFGKIRINDYTLQSGVGGSTGCNVAGIMPVGTVAHETGHGFNLPDLYDTNPTDGDDSQGIGEWGLMSSGNYRVPSSPAHMEGYSRMTLGWVRVRNLTTNGTYTVGPYNVGDTILRVAPTVSNPRTESYLLENRQGTLSDSALIRSKGPGLLIFHVDQAQINAASSNNTVNSGPIHGLKIEQADGLNNLGVDFNTGASNRGDAGDPYPGTSGNTVFGAASSPAAIMNTGAFPGFVIDSIRQVTPGGAMSFRLRFGFPVTFTTAGAGTIASSPTAPSGTLLSPGDSVTLTASAGGAVSFVGWSGDTTTGSAALKLRATRAWSVVANFASPLVVTDTILAAPVMGTPFADTLRMSGGNGSYAFALLAGTLPPGLTLGADGILSGVAARDSTFNFTVRVTSGPQTLDLPIRVRVTAPALAAANVVAKLLGGTSSLTPNDITYLDLLGNHNGGLDLGDFVAWLDHTGTTVSAATMQRLLTRSPR